MNQITASRTLVKSPPELWAECSDAESLARHLGEFGEIRITKLEPETAVAWEGEEFSGTVRLEPSGWGTKVVITASSPSLEAPDPPAPTAESAAEAEPDQELPAAGPEPEFEPIVPDAPDPEPTPAVRRGLVARLLGRFGRPPAPAPSPQADGCADRLSTPEQSAPEAPLDEVTPGPEAQSRPEPDPPSEHEQHLHTALDSLGQAHRRPFSHG
jgi:hypothetical protein